MHMLRHQSRARRLTRIGAAMKCIHKTDQVVTVHNHQPIACLYNRCYPFVVHSREAQLNHYRESCSRWGSTDCSGAKFYIKDGRIGFYKKQLIEAATKALKQMKLI